MLINDVLGIYIYGVDNYMFQFDWIIYYLVDIKVCFVNIYLFVWKEIYLVNSVIYFLIGNQVLEKLLY